MGTQTRPAGSLKHDGSCNESPEVKVERLTVKELATSMIILFQNYNPIGG